MIASRLLSRHGVLRMLGLYKCRFVRAYPEGFELWETGWGEPFTLAQEAADIYDEWQVRQVIAGVIATTLPQDWFPNGNGG